MRLLRDKTLPSRMMFVMLSTTLAALIAAGAALFIYDLRTFRTAWIDDLNAMAEVLGRATAPALQFNDTQSALGDLRLTEARPQIAAAAIYDAKGRLFASYRGAKQGSAAVPAEPGEGIAIDGGRITLFRPIIENGERLGTIYLEARYSIFQRVRTYLLILLGVLLLSLLVALVVYGWLQDSITRPILAISEVARRIVRNRDFSERAPPVKGDDEVAALTAAFNSMLAELEKRKHANDAALEAVQHEAKERRDAEEALRLTDRRKDEFLAMLAHELRNPLAPIATGLAILKRTGNDAEVARQMRDSMERQLRQLTRLVDDLLNVSRISTGKMTIQRERIDLREAVHTALDTVAPSIEANRHQLDVDLPEAPVWIQGDQLRLAQVFSNLLNNAAKYTPAGGHLAITLRVEGSNAVVSVNDDGIGIPADMLDTIFDMFTQADRSLERSPSGLGVGLTLARRLIELHDGSIRAANRVEAGGAVFTVRLPLDNDAIESRGGVR